MPTTDQNIDRFRALLRDSIESGTLSKLTLGRHRGPDASLRNLFVRPVALAAGPHLSFVWRHATRDVTKNFRPAVALVEIEKLLGRDFLDAHLFTPGSHAQLECAPGRPARLRVVSAPAAPAPAAAHDRPKDRLIPDDAPWLQALGVTDAKAHPRKDMAPKFRQIQKFAELLVHLAEEADLAGAPALSVADMGCGKGYLTFAVASVLPQAVVRGIEVRPELVELCNRVALEQGFAPRLGFEAGTIDSAAMGKPDILIALHACDTATDDALARAIGAGCRLILAAPCCQKELRPQIAPPPVLASVLRHGIFRERHAEFATDALRALLLEWSGYRTQVMEFVSTEHTAKNLMITAIKKGPGGDETAAKRAREFAAFYGVERHALATRLNFEFSGA